MKFSGFVFLLSAACLLFASPLYAGELVGAYIDLDKADHINLSAEGTLDWSLWGLGGPNTGSTTPDSRKTVGGLTIGLIGPLAEINGDATTDGGGWSFSPLWSWSDGAPPNPSGSSQYAAIMSRNNGTGAGFTLSVPADTTTRTVLVYVAAWNSEATFTAWLSDASAPAYVDSSFTTGSFDRVGVFRVDYAANSANQTLDLKWQASSDLGSNESVSVCAVTLTTPDTLEPLDVQTQYYDPINIAGTSGGGAISLGSGDLNNDGYEELITTATTNSSQPHFRVYHRSTTTAAWSVIDILSPAVVDDRRDRFGGDCFIIDMNLDGWADILLPESNNNLGAGIVSWFENPKRADLGATWTEHVISSWSGSGTTSPQNYVRHMSEIYAGDIDNDGDVDVITRDVQYGLFVLVNNGGNPDLASSFDRVHIAVNPREGLALFDPDYDGDLDILINGVWLETPDNPLTGQYVIHDIKKASDNSSPWYPSTNNAATRNDYACKVYAADFNGDGLDDVAITNSEELSGDSSSVKPEGLWVYLANDDSGDSWTEVIIRNYGFDLHTLHAGDIDLDGDMDILTGISTVGLGNSAADVFVYLNDGDGLDWDYQHVSNVNIYSGIMVDADGDGDLDIVGPDNWNSGPFRLIEAQAPQPAQIAGDANRDGQVNLDDFIILKQNYGTGSSATWDMGDFNGDAKVNLDDFIILKQNYGTGA